MIVIRRATLVASAAVLGFHLGAQRGVLPFGLKAGRHAVRVQTVGGRTSWTPEDSGIFPAVVISADGPTALDSVLPWYLASHGFRVARVQKNGIEAAMRTLGDATPVAVVQWGRDSAAAAQLDGTQPLSIRVVHPGAAPSGRLRITLPPPGTRPGAEERRYRLLCAVTQAILNATLAAARPTLPELATRLRAAGLQGTYIRDS